MICFDTGKPQASTQIDCLIATDQETNRLIAAAELEMVQLLPWSLRSLHQAATLKNSINFHAMIAKRLLDGTIC